jgi:hypothetical protein
MTTTPVSPPDRRRRSARSLEHPGRAAAPKTLQEAALYRALVWRVSGSRVEQRCDLRR